jgi:ribosomal protein S27E
MGGVHVPRSPTTSVLYGVVRGHLPALLAAVDAETDGSRLPGFVVNEFRKFLRCGVLAHGFARVRCRDCAYERLVPFSCKGRAVCPSCGGRRMMERASHLVDHVLQVFVRALRSAYRRQGRRQGFGAGETGMVTSIQRFGGAVNAHLHFHTIVLDGLFVRESDGTLRFHPAPPPTDDDVRRVVARVRRRLERLGLVPSGP